MAIAQSPIQRRMKEIEGTSDLTKALTIAGGAGAGFFSGGNPAAISAGAKLGNTVGGMGDQDRIKNETAAAERQGMTAVKKEDDFDKVFQLAGAGADTYNAMPESKPPPAPKAVGFSNDGPSYDVNSAMKRRMKAYGGY